MHPPRVLIVDDHAMFRTGLALVIRAALPDATVHEVGALEQAMALETDAMDVVLLDVQLQGINGLAGIAPMRRRWPGARLLVVSSHTDAHSVREAHARGADGFIAKTESAAKIVEAIRLALSGAQVVHPSASTPTSRSLTPRQCEVIELMHQGLPNKTIARRLDLSENTVRRHVQDILAFFDVGSRTEAVFVARQRGLVY
ncbi:MAG: response regulator transcription factor [Variovorax sp.]